MNKLRNQRIYESGAIDRCPNLGVDWRQEIENKLINKYGCIVYNPMSKPLKIAGEHENRHLRKQWKENGEYDKLAEFIKEIRHVDLRLCDRADAGIFYLDLDIYATGTFEELFLMNRQKKPVMIVCKQGKVHTPDWLFGVVNHQFIYNNWDELFQYLDKIDAGYDDGSNRWLVFDY